MTSSSQRILQVLADHLPPDAPFWDHPDPAGPWDLDSLDRLAFVLHLEREFGVHFPANALAAGCFGSLNQTLHSLQQAVPLQDKSTS